MPRIHGLDLPCQRRVFFGNKLVEIRHKNGQKIELKENKDDDDECFAFHEGSIAAPYQKRRTRIAIAQDWSSDEELKSPDDCEEENSSTKHDADEIESISDNLAVGTLLASSKRKCFSSVKSLPPQDEMLTLLEEPIQPQR